MRTFFWLTVAAYAGVWWWGFVSVEGEVPLHFGLRGDPDAWGGRTEALLMTAVVGGLIAGLLAASAWWAGRADLASPWVNLPAKSWWTATPERAARARRMIRSDLYAVGGLTMVVMTVALAATVRASHQAEPQLGSVSVVVLVLALVGLLAYCAWLTLWRYRPDEPGGSGWSRGVG